MDLSLGLSEIEINSRAEYVLKSLLFHLTYFLPHNHGNALSE